ncbi:unnamed protein product [Fraxinus pennsylvanica]|uniref:non-specific serine/threonine protein kinase n=1 Tax=Fraxinus pennsylvanica TaxID=56036 RepID=A0AAD2ADV0_9LAMI|nr:unnamed protein product [Fraxinus pennsylvanica]
MGTCWPKPVDSRPTTNSCSSPVHNDAKLIKNRNRHDSNSNSNNHENSRLSAADPNRGGEGGRGGSDHQGVPLSESKTERNSDGARGKDNNGQKINVASTFTFEELAMATQNFRESNLIGKGGFGSVYKGCLDSDVVVAVKQLNLEGLQGNQEFIVEVFMLSLLHHPNLVNLIGYCAHEEQRFLVYEYMPLGSLDRLLFEPDQKPLGWSTRLKIALDVAHGLEYLHCKTNPPVIYRDMKSSNILLDNDFNARLSDFGVSKLGPIGENTHVSTRVVGTYGYCAPEYVVSGKLTLNSDIYSFGVVLLELITGRKVIDHTRKSGEKNLVMWFLPFLKDHKKFVQMADPLLEMRFSIRSLHHAIAITAMCLQEQPSFRPAISDIVTALESVASQMGISDHHQGRIRVGHKNLEA